MKAVPMILVSGEGYVKSSIQEATHLKLNFPGPVGELVLPVMIGGSRAGTHNWTWNGDVDKPTLKPSIKTTGHDFVCHTWVNDGMAIFHDDSTHDLRGQTVEMLEVS